jgi:Ca-activated chloride channel homolog
MRVLPLTVSVVAFAIVLAGQDKPLRLQVDVRSVSVDVGAFDSSGRPLINLTREDFRLLEDGVPQEIISFEPVSAPYNVLVLFDCSGSTIAAQPLFSDATAALAAHLRPQDDLAVAAFGTKITLLLDRKSGTRRSLNSIWRTCGETVFYDALRWGVDRIQKFSGRKGIIVFTDGRDSDAEKMGTIDGVRLSMMKPIGEDRRFQDTLQLVARSRVPIYLLAANTDRNPYSMAIPEDHPNRTEARMRMEQLAEATGGRVAFPQALEEIVPLYERIGRELSNAYTLTYTPTRPWTTSGFRKIDVLPRTGDVRITQSRSGYSPR